MGEERRDDDEEKTEKEFAERQSLAVFSAELAWRPKPYPKML
jgi:hypothetical protein